MEAFHNRMFEEFQVQDMIVDGEIATTRDKIAVDLWRDFTQGYSLYCFCNILSRDLYDYEYPFQLVFKMITWRNT